MEISASSFGDPNLLTPLVPVRIFFVQADHNVIPPLFSASRSRFVDFPPLLFLKTRGKLENYVFLYLSPRFSLSRSTFPFLDNESYSETNDHCRFPLASLFFF